VRNGCRHGGLGR